MSDKVNNKRQAAMRLFGAMSGVDEKYLAACEDAKGATGQSGVLLFMRRYGKAMAAVLCLAVLGAGYFALQSSVKYSENATAMDMVAQSMAPSEPKYADEAAAEEEVVAEAPEAFYDNEETDGVVRNDAASGSSAIGNKEQFEQEKTTVEQSFVSSEVEEMTITEAEALDVVGQYIPTDWPVGGAISQVLDSGTTDEASVTLFWTYDNNGEGFCVKIDNLGEEIPDWVTEEMSEDYVVGAEEFTKEYVESQIKTPSADSGDTDMPGGRFGVLYKTDSEYVLVRFDGRGTVDEIWEMMN